MNDRTRLPHGRKANRAELAKTPETPHRAETERRSDPVPVDRPASSGRPTRAVLYYRVSTDRQNEENQMPALRAYTEFRKWKIVKEYVDHGISGGKDSRPDLDVMMSEIRAGKYDVLLVYSYDRFARSLPHLVLVMDELGHLGVAFASYHEQIDTTTPQGRLLFAFYAGLAEWTRHQIAQKTRDTLARLKNEGIKLGRPTLPDDVRERIFALRAQGLSVRKIADQIEWVRASGEYGKRKVEKVSKSAVAKVLAERPLNPPSNVASDVDGASVA